MSAALGSTAADAAAGGSHVPFLESVSGAVGRNEGRVAVVLVDVAHLAEMRARAGFAASDAALACVHEALRSAVRSRDAVLRVGDAAFGIVVLAVQNRGHARLAAEKIWRVADATMSQLGMGASPGVHVGVALYPVDATEPNELIRRAQLASTSARRRGERLAVYEDSCAEQVIGRWSLEQEFATALESGEMEMHFQPKIDISAGRVTGAEALMRWLRDGRPVATPDVFIPLAEGAGLGLPAAIFALNSSLRQAAEWRAVAADLGVAVNISAEVMRHRDFIAMVQSALATWHAAPASLTLEITEGALITDFERTSAKLRELRGTGVRISIDDFGTGYSSLSYFKRIPADELKIDKSFVQRMLQDEADANIVRTIVQLARQFDLTVVAEGVEDTATFEALARIGCDHAQGYLFARPLAQEQFVRWLAQPAMPRPAG